MIAQDTTSLSHEFGPLLENEEFNIVTSPDKRLRIYVTKCDTEVGVSMNLVQYRDSLGTIHTINAEQYTQQIPGRWGFYADEIEILNNGKVIQKSDLEKPTIWRI